MHNESGTLTRLETLDDTNFTDLDLSDKPEEKNDAHESSDISLALEIQEEIKFYYLHEISKEDLEKLKIEFEKLPKELEQLVADHPHLFWYYRVKNYLALGSNLLYLVFLINTSYEGIQSFADVIKPGMLVPKPVGYGIGIPISVIDTIFHSLLYSALNEAAKSTIRYTLSDPLIRQLQKKIAETFNKRLSALIETGKFTVNQTVLLSVNLTSIMTEIIDIYKNMEDLPLAFRVPIIASILYFGNYYLTKYFNPDYYEGLNFWFNNQKNPWLVGEIWRGNFAIPLQIFLQGIVSTVGIRTYPFYYYLAEASAETFNGFWFPTWLVVTCVTWHSLCALYPYTFNHYMSNQEKVETLLKANINWDKVDKRINQLLSELHLNDLSSDKIEKYKALAVKDYISSEKNLLAQKVFDKHGTHLVKKEIAVQLVARGALGGYFGYQVLSSFLMLFINEPISMSICGAVFGAGLFAKALYNAEKKRRLDELMVQELQKIDAENKNIIIDIINNINPTCTSSTFLSRVVADTTNIVTGIANVASTMGTEARIFGTSTVSVIFVALTSIESSINGILFNKEKVRSTVHSGFDSIARVSSTPGTLYNRFKNKIRVLNSPTESLLPTHRLSN